MKLFIKRFSVVFVAMILILGAAIPCLASSSPENFTIWPTQETNIPNKVWSIKFNMPMSSQTVNNNNIYVKDENNNLISTSLSLSSDGTSVNVTPKSPYMMGSNYQLYITNGLTNVKGDSLGSQIIVPFILVDSKAKIYSVKSQYTALVTSFEVKTSQDVYSVKINQDEMHYQGNNTFTLGVVSLKQGSIVTVYAYSSTGTLLSSQKYTIN